MLTRAARRRSYMGHRAQLLALAALACALLVPIATQSASAAAGDFVLSGRVVTAATEGVGPVAVVACPTATNAVMPICGAGAVVTTTGTDGSFTFALDHDAAATWHFRALIAGTPSAESQIASVAGASTLPDITLPVRVLQGTVTGVNPGTSKVNVCRAPQTDLGCTPARNETLLVATGPLSGSYRLVVPDVDVNVFVGSDLGTLAGQSGLLRTEAKTVPGGTSPASVDFDPVTWGTVFGTVSYNGSSVFGANQAGVGACPAPGQGPGCPGLRYIFANADGSYRLNLTPGSYRLAGFVLVSGVPVIGPPALDVVIDQGDLIARDFVADPDGVEAGVEAGAPNAGDGNGDGIPDAVQDQVASLPGANNGYLSLAVANGSALSSVANEPVTVADNLGDAGTVAFPTGSTEFIVAPVATGATVQVTIRLEQAPAPGTQYYKLVSDVPVLYPQAAIVGNTLTLTLTDGGAGDSDGTANGVIRDPGGLGAPLGFGASATVPGVPNGAKAGSAVNVRWRTTAAGLPVADPSANRSLTSNCAGQPGGAPTYLGNGDWSQTWKTVKGSSATCRFTVTLAGGSSSTSQAITLRK